PPVSRHFPAALLCRAFPTFRKRKSPRVPHTGALNGDMRGWGARGVSPYKATTPRPCISFRACHPVLEIDIRQLLAAAVLHDKAGVQFLNCLRWGKPAFWHSVHALWRPSITPPLVF